MMRRSVVPAAPVGQQGASRARRCVSRVALRSARGSLPVDYWDGLQPA